MNATKRAAVLCALSAFSFACSQPAAERAEPITFTPSSGRVEARELGDIERLHVAGDVLFASQPTEADFARLASAGVATVIDLRRPSESRGFDERAAATAAGLRYENVPFGSAAELNDATFARIRELLANAPRPVLVHCAAGNRAGAVWIPWRVLDGGVALDQAVAEARAIGMGSAELEAAARAYVARQQR